MTRFGIGISSQQAGTLACDFHSQSGRISNYDSCYKQSK